MRSDVNTTSRRVCISTELAFRANGCPVARTSEDRADEIIDSLMAVMTELRADDSTDAARLREAVASIGGRVFAWLEAIDGESAR